MKQIPRIEAHRWFCLMGLALACLASRLVGDPLTGGTFSLSGAVTSGGGRTQGGDYVVEGTAGQPTTDTSQGGDYELTGGLIGVYVVPGDVTVTIERMEDGQVKLTWPANAVGVTLQFSPQLGPIPDWQSVTPAPTGNTYVTPADQPLRFFRVRAP